ncbi:MAG: insulinase family protein, partial [Deltaproteobacteria bacterium]|nr:insulinase family protein [Deltaproteobacteria bacterium]
MSAAVAKGHLRRQPTTLDSLAKVDLDKAMAIYKQRFADASDFTFVFVGNIDVATFKPMVEKYLASLPTVKRRDKWKDVRVQRPRGRKTMEVFRGQEPKSYFYLLFHNRSRWSADAENDMRMLGEVLRIRLREILREDMGGVYGVSSGGSIARRPKQRHGFRVFFGCDPDNVEKLKQAVMDEIKIIQNKGIDDEYIGKVKNMRIRRHEVDLRENYYWSRELADAYRYGDDPKGILDFKKYVDKVSSKRVRAAARKYLRANQYFTAVLRPEKDKAKGKGGK